jgi:hypothetical protein
MNETPGNGLAARLHTGPLGKLGPGLITGAADDDPSSIATYSQAGDQFEVKLMLISDLTGEHSLFNGL